METNMNLKRVKQRKQPNWTRGKNNLYLVIPPDGMKSSVTLGWLVSMKLDVIWSYHNEVGTPCCCDEVCKVILKVKKIYSIIYHRIRYHFSVAPGRLKAGKND